MQELRSQCNRVIDYEDDLVQTRGGRDWTDATNRLTGRSGPFSSPPSTATDTQRHPSGTLTRDDGIDRGSMPRYPTTPKGGPGSGVSAPPREGRAPVCRRVPGYPAHAGSHTPCRVEKGGRPSKEAHPPTHSRRVEARNSSSPSSSPSTRPSTSRSRWRYARSRQTRSWPSWTGRPARG